jgi:PAS domain S-box-containing protein/putative nucleotidyltransferase with HDIG domain
MDDLLLHIRRAVEWQQSQLEIQRLASFPELNPSPVIEIDASGEVTYLNPAAGNFFPDLGSEGMQHPLLADMQDIFAASMKGETREAAREVEVGNATYERRLYSIPANKLIRITVLDITKRKQAEQKLQESEQRFRLLFDKMLNGFALHEIILDDEGKPVDYRFLDANPAFERLTGLKAVDIIGKTVREVLPRTEPAWIEEYGKVALTGEPRNFEQFSAELDKYYSVSVYRPAERQFAVVFDDITERRLGEIALTRLNRTLRTLSAGNEVLVHAADETTLLHEMCRTIAEQGNYRFTWFGFVEHTADQRVRPVASAGYEEGYLESLHITWADNEHGQGPTGRAVRLGSPQIAGDIVNDPQFAPWREQALQRGYASSIALPLKDEKGEVFGVLNIYANLTNAFDEAEVKLLQELTDDLAFGILNLRIQQERNQFQQENLQSAVRLKEALTSAIRAIALTVEKRDPYTAGHQNRVADLAAAMAGELGFDVDRIEGLRLGGMIHDIGKIYIPAEILNRPGRLSEHEFEMIKSHPEVGYDIIKDVVFPWPVADIVLQHHERLDGSGYPGGLKGDEIILEARILAVADVVEAITAHRPYRAALGIEVALDEITKHRGVFYDPAVVDVCLALFREKGFAW